MKDMLFDKDPCVWYVFYLHLLDSLVNRSEYL